MAKLFAICRKNSKEMRSDSKHKCALLFETRADASKYLKRVKSPRDKYDSEIVEVDVIVRRVR